MVERDNQRLYGSGSLPNFFVLPSSEKKGSSWKIMFNAILLHYVPTGVLIDIDSDSGKR